MGQPPLFLCTNWAYTYYLPCSSLPTNLPSSFLSSPKPFLIIPFLVSSLFATQMATTSLSSSSSSKTAEVDAPLHAIGFEVDVVSAKEVNGTLKVTEANCQPFKVLHGGISALIAEALASIGAHVASGFRRIAGIQLSINHHRSARLGDLIFARATPIHVGKTIQVWEIHLRKVNPATQEKGELLASSKVTLLSNMPVPQDAKDAEDTLRKYARL